MNPAALLQAACFAARKHRDQRRKDAAESPYINHPLAGVNVLASEAGVIDQSLLIAALLHDTVEDTETTFDELQEAYGEVVRRIVEEVTDDKGLPKETRKELQIRHAANASNLAKQLKIADKVCNIRDIASNPPSRWSEDRKVQYLEWASQVVTGCRGVNLKLDQVYGEAMTMAREKLGVEKP